MKLLSLCLLLVFPVQASVIREPSPADIRAMAESSVQILVHISGLLVKKPYTGRDGKTITPPPEEIEGGWVGSGVVVDVKEGQSFIMTANHVAETPTVGTELEIRGGTIVVTAVAMEIKTFPGAFCKAKAKVLGTTDDSDVAIVQADCEAGPVAHLAKAAPEFGTKVWDVGAPLGMHPNGSFTVVSGYWQGYTDGPEGQYVSLSVPVIGGFSGSAIFNAKGEIVSILVRGSRDYAQIALGIKLQTIAARLAQAESIGW